MIAREIIAAGAEPSASSSAPCTKLLLAGAAPPARRGLLSRGVLVLGAVASVQFGAALAVTLFDEVGPGGTVLLRLGFARGRAPRDLATGGRAR